VARDAIRKNNYNPIFVGINKFVIKQKPPNRMHELAPKMCENIPGSSFAKLQLIKILNGVVKLKIRVSFH
jgi:hypothetical protein